MEKDRLNVKCECNECIKMVCSLWSIQCALSTHYFQHLPTISVDWAAQKYFVLSTHHFRYINDKIGINFKVGKDASFRTPFIYTTLIYTYIQYTERIDFIILKCTRLLHTNQHLIRFSVVSMLSPFRLTIIIVYLYCI